MRSCLTVNTRNMISSLSDLGYPIHDTKSPTPLDNDNNACVKWCHNMTTKGNRHIENRKNSTREWVANGTISVVSPAATSPSTHVLGLVAAALTTKVKNKGSSPGRVFYTHPLPSVVPCHFSDFTCYKVLPLGFEHRLLNLCSSLLL
jgi:hypothetical protein